MIHDTTCLATIHLFVFRTFNQRLDPLCFLDLVEGVFCVAELDLASDEFLDADSAGRE